MEIKCNKCGHTWKYKGKSDYYITCPSCYTKVNIQKFRESHTKAHTK
jgi:ribosomal protein S27E